MAAKLFRAFLALVMLFFISTPVVARAQEDPGYDEGSTPVLEVPDRYRDNVADRDNPDWADLFKRNAYQGQEQVEVLSEEALVVLNLTRERINDEFTKSGDLGVFKEGVLHPGSTDVPAGSKGVPITFSTEEHGSFIVWLFVSSRHTQGLQEITATKQAWHKEKKIFYPIAAGLTGGTAGALIGTTIKRRGATVLGAVVGGIVIGMGTYFFNSSLNPTDYLGNMTPFQSPWNSDANLWEKFVSAMKFQAIQAINSGTPKRTADEPNVIWFAVHPQLLKEVRDIWLENGWIGGDQPHKLEMGK